MENIVTKTDDNGGQLRFYIWNQALDQYVLASLLDGFFYSRVRTAFITSFKRQSDFVLIVYWETQVEGGMSLRKIQCTDYKCTFGGIWAGSDSTNIDITTWIDICDAQILNFNDTGANISYLKDKVQNGSKLNSFRAAYVGDANGDCLADLTLLEGKNKLIFLKGAVTNTYIYQDQVIFQDQIQHYTHRDINSDGKQDIIILLTNGYLQIHYHLGGGEKELCKAMPNAHDIVPSSTQLKMIHRVYLGDRPCKKSVLLFGDVNNDGYDDLTVTFLPQGMDKPIAKLFINSPCTGSECGTYNPLFIQNSDRLNSRTFKYIKLPYPDNYIAKISFIDIMQDGNLDGMLHIYRNNMTQIQAVYNNINYDAFFVTIQILSTSTSSNYFSNTQYIGATSSLYVTLISGQLAPRSDNQLAQVGHTLALPHIRLGLGRTNNYIQNLVITVPRKFTESSLYQFKWSPIIPNSDILIVPPVASDAGKQQWLLKVLIQPTQKLGMVAMLVVLSLAIIGFAIIKLTNKEKQIDKQDIQSFYTTLV